MDGEGKNSQESRGIQYGVEPPWALANSLAGNKDDEMEEDCIH
jgi:hypothetical protein